MTRAEHCHERCERLAKVCLGRIIQAEPAIRIADCQMRPGRHIGLRREPIADLAEAEKLYREALAIYRKALGDEHGFVAFALNDLALVKHAQGEWAEAERLHRDAIAMREKLLGKEHPDTLISRRSLAAVLRDAGNLETARAMLKEVSETATRVMPPGHWLAADFRSDYGDCLLRFRQYEAAERELIAAHTALQAALGSEHVRTVDTVRRLVAVYEEWGKAEKAAEWRLRR